MLPRALPEWFDAQELGMQLQAQQAFEYANFGQSVVDICPICSADSDLADVPLRSGSAVKRINELKIS